MKKGVDWPLGPDFILLIQLTIALDWEHERKRGTIAMKDSKGVIRWIKEHKKVLIIAGISIGMQVEWLSI